MRRDRPAAMMPSTVLDPFTGSGTTGLVALRHRTARTRRVSFVISENLKRVLSTYDFYIDEWRKRYGTKEPEDKDANN